jgi:hypothetical protein
MTQGTFMALSKNPQYFLQNTTSFDRVNGNIFGNILTIRSENTQSVDTISWMVIAERKDPEIINDILTDSEGSLIPELNITMK